MNRYANNARAIRPTTRFSIMSLQFFAPAGVEPARDKKKRDDGEVDEVSHGFCFKLRVLGARLTPPPNYLDCGGNPAEREPRRFYSVGRRPKAVSPLRSATALQNPRGISCAHSAIRAAADTRAPFHLPVELNRARSCPHNDATPTRRLIKKWAVGVKNVLRNDLPKKTLPRGAPKRLIS